MSSPDGIVERNGIKTKYADLGLGDGVRGEVVATVSLDQTPGARDDIDAVAYVRANGKPVLCPAGTTTILTGSGNGAAGDIITRLSFIVTDNSTGTVTLKDGDGTVYSDGTTNPFNNLLIRAANSVVYTFDLDQQSYNGPWSITTGAGVSVLAQGTFA